VKRRTLLLIGVILMFVALLPFVAWPIYKKLAFRAISADQKAEPEK
jgi:hypothetical protein